MDRAQALIRTGFVQLSNPWMERRWSTLLGATTELTLSGSPRGDCLTRKSPEFHLDFGGKPYAVHDLGETNWSEKSDHHGCTLTMTQSATALSLRLDNFMAHRSPGMVRQLEILNRSQSTVRLSRVAVEILPLDPEQFRTPSASDGNDAAPENIFAQNDRRYCALTSQAGTLILESPQPTEFSLFTPNPQYCAVVWKGTLDLAPRAVWKSPRSTLFWASGNQLEHIESNLDILRADWNSHNQDR